MAPARTVKRIARWLAFVGLVLFAGEAQALEVLDLVGEWKDGNNKIHRIKVHGGARILLCRPVAEVSGGFRAYRGGFAQGGFELVSKPRTIDDLNNKLPAALRRALLRLGASYGAKIKITDKGRKLIVQYITGTVTWTKSDPTKVDSIKKKLGRKVTLTHVIATKTVVEIARRKATRSIWALANHNRSLASNAYQAINKHLLKLVDERWITPEERGLFDYHAKRIRSISGAWGRPDTQLLNLKSHYRWAVDYDTGKIIRRWRPARRAGAIAAIQKTMPMVRWQMRWLLDLLRADSKLLTLRNALPDAAGLRELKKMNALFRKSHRTEELITLDDYAAFVRIYARLKPELAAIAKSKTVAKPTFKPYYGPVTPPGVELGKVVGRGVVLSREHVDVRRPVE